MYGVGPCEIFDVAPWTNAHLQMRKFSDRLKDLGELVQLYPNIAKDDAFGPYYTNDGKQDYNSTVSSTWNDMQIPME